MQISFALYPDLVDIYRNDIWGEHPDALREDWQRDAGNGDTQLGYWEWASARLEYLAGE